MDGKVGMDYFVDKSKSVDAEYMVRCFSYFFPGFWLEFRTFLKEPEMVPLGWGLLWLIFWISTLYHHQLKYYLRLIPNSQIFYSTRNRKRGKNHNQDCNMKIPGPLFDLSRENDHFCTEKLTLSSIEGSKIRFRWSMFIWVP